MGKIGAGVLLKDDIKKADIVSEYAVEACYQTASYDLRIGDSWIPTDDGQQKGSSERLAGEKIVVPAFGSLIVSTHEVLKLPLNVVGKFNLRIKLALKGLFVQMGTQVEPGYYGRLFAVLNNITNEDIEISIKDPEEKGGDVVRERVFTIEFFTTTNSAPEPTEPMKPIRKISDWVISSAFAKSSISAVVKDVSKNSQDIAAIQTELPQQQEIVLNRLTERFSGKLDSMEAEWQALKKLNDAQSSIDEARLTAVEERLQGASTDLGNAKAEVEKTVDALKSTRWQFWGAVVAAGIFLTVLSAIIPVAIGYAVNRTDYWAQQDNGEPYRTQLRLIEAELQALKDANAASTELTNITSQVTALEALIIELQADLDYIKEETSAEGAPSPGDN